MGTAGRRFASSSLRGGFRFYGLVPQSIHYRFGSRHPAGDVEEPAISAEARGQAGSSFSADLEQAPAFHRRENKDRRHKGSFESRPFGGGPRRSNQVPRQRGGGGPLLRAAGRRGRA